MNNLFDKRDILTGITADQAVKGDKGYFGGSLRTIAYNVEQDNVHRLCDINEDETSCFTDEEGLDYLFFLPADKVKEKVKEPVYRPIKNIDELFNFLVPTFTADYNTFDKADIIFTFVFELKSKNSGYMHYKKFTSIRVTDDGIVLDAFTLDHYFENYEIKQNGEFIPFGILEE